MIDLLRSQKIAAHWYNLRVEKRQEPPPIPNKKTLQALWKINFQCPSCSRASNVLGMLNLKLLSEMETRERVTR